MIRRHRQHRPRGSVYVAILGLSVLVGIIGLGGIALSRAQARSRDLQADTAEARQYAMSAVEWARTLINADPNWRTSHTNGPWITNQSFGNGKISIDVTNPSGTLNNADTDAVVITGTGAKGLALQKVQVTLGALLTPYTCMATTITAGGIMTLGGTTISGAGSTIACGLAATALGGDIYPDIEAAGLVTGGAFHGNSTSLATPRTLPPAAAFDYYTANATPIIYNDIPNGSGGVVLQNCLLSPSNNPYGLTNAKGLYIINCGGSTITIQSCRIVGTLILINPGSGSCVSNNVAWEPALPNYPCLMVSGNFLVKSGGGTLNESNNTGNLNPAATPYPYVGGASNTNTTDKLPCAISGLVYASGNITTQGSPTISQIICGGNFTSSSTLILNYNPLYWTSPPPGFRTLTMTPQSGTWKQVVY